MTAAPEIPTRPSRHRPALGFVTLILALGLLGPALAQAGGGKLVQKPGPTGCIAQGGSKGACATGKALADPYSVVVSADGKNAYVASSGAIAVFDRNARSGALTQKAGKAGCISWNGKGGTDQGSGSCATGTAIKYEGSVTISPDGRNVYATFLSPSNSVAVFNRDPQTGALKQKKGTAGCVSESGSGGSCVAGRALHLPHSVAVSPDGSSVYVASYGSDAVAIFDRNPTTGALTQKPGTAGCISKTGTEGDCVDGRALNGADAVVVSADGTSVYAASFAAGAVSIFDRDPVTGALAQKAGTAGCIANKVKHGTCADGRALAYADAVTVSPDGANAYVTAANSNAVSIFDRDPVTGALEQKAGTAGCIAETTLSGSCTNGKALTGAGSVAVSPDGANVYVAATGRDAIAVFNRAARTGALTQKAGKRACVAQRGAACTRGRKLGVVRSVTVSPDGRTLYAASEGGDAVTVFDRTEKQGIAALGRPASAGAG